MTGRISGQTRAVVVDRVAVRLDFGQFTTDKTYGTISQSFIVDDIIGTILLCL
jgi:hypothetical protein